MIIMNIIIGFIFHVSRYDWASIGHVISDASISGDFEMLLTLYDPNHLSLHLRSSNPNPERFFRSIPQPLNPNTALSVDEGGVRPLVWMRVGSG